MDGLLSFKVASALPLYPMLRLAGLELSGSTVLQPQPLVVAGTTGISLVSLTPLSPVSICLVF